MSSPETSIRRATRSDASTLCSVLGRAFDDDPVSCYIFPSARRRERGLRSFFKMVMVHELLPLGEVYTTAGRQGVAMWAPPPRPPVQGLRALLGLVPVAPYVMGHLGSTVRLLARVQAAHPTEPHWYLSTLGTEPSRQGKGIGSALLSPVLSRCDEDGFPAYLESSKESNLAFYRRHGFEVTGEISGHGAPTLWTMWREPTPPSI